MKALIYLLLRRYINSLRRAFLRPLSAVLTVLALVVLLGSISAAFLFPHPGIGASLEAVVACIMLGMGLLILNAVLGSSQNGIFTLQDANLIFQAPVPRGYVLMYAILDVIPASLLTALFFTFYFPFLVGDRLTLFAYLLVLLFAGMMIAFVYLVFYYIYIMDIGHPGLRRRIKHILWVLMLLEAFSFLMVLYTKDFNLSRAAETSFASPFYKAIPVFGWVQWGVVSAFEGRFLSGCLPAGLLLLGINVLLAVAMLRTDVDFYEKALSDSYKIKEILDGVKSSSYDARSTVKVKKQPVRANFKPGAAALLSRQLLEMKKTSTLFVFRDFISGGVYIVMAKFMNLGFNFTFFMLLFMSLTIAGSDSWNKDFKKPYVYLIPESSYRKALYSVLPGLVRTIIIGSVVVAVSGVLFSVPVLELAAYILINASFSLVFVMSEILSYKVMKGRKSPIVLSFLRMLFVTATAVPAAVILAILYLLWPNSVSVLIIAPILLCVNLLMFFAMAGMSRNLFEQSELY